MPISQSRPSGPWLSLTPPLASFKTPWGPSTAPAASSFPLLAPKLWYPLLAAGQDSLNPSFPVARQQMGEEGVTEAVEATAPSQAHLLPPGGRLLL